MNRFLFCWSRNPNSGIQMILANCSSSALAWITITLFTLLWWLQLTLATFNSWDKGHFVRILISLPAPAASSCRHRRRRHLRAWLAIMTSLITHFASLADTINDVDIFRTRLNGDKPPPYVTCSVLFTVSIILFNQRTTFDRDSPNTRRSSSWYYTEIYKCGSHIGCSYQ